MLLKFPELFSGTQLINFLTNVMPQEDKKKTLKISLIENEFETLQKLFIGLICFPHFIVPILSEISFNLKIYYI